MTPLRRKAFRTIPVICCLLSSSAFAAGGGADDPTIENAASLLSRAFDDTKDTPVGESREAGLIVSALRSSRDKDVVPLFEILRQSNRPENQIYGMVAEVILTKDPAKLDLGMLLGNKDQQLVTSAIVALLETEADARRALLITHESPEAIAAFAASQVVTNDQLQQILRDASDPTVKAMAIEELNTRKSPPDRNQVLALLKSDKEAVRYCATLIALKDKDPEMIASALKVLRELSTDHSLRQASIQSLILSHIQAENLRAASPWVAEVAADEKNEDGLRRTAISALLALQHPDAPRILADMIQKQQEVIQQVKLGLISLEFASQVKPEVLDPIAQARSTLVSTIGRLAQEGARGRDITPGLEKLLKQGHPIVLDWSLIYSDRTEPDRRLRILTTLIGQSTIVDDVRGRDFERAAVASQKLITLAGAEGRGAAASLLKSNNHAVVEAVLAGIYGSTIPNQSELVMPVWDTLRKTKGSEMATNYAALILAREGHVEVSDWLRSMVLGSTVQNPGFRGIAGWYYGKLQGKSGVILQEVIASSKR